MVGIRLFPFGMAHFQVRAVSFSECILLGNDPSPMAQTKPESGFMDRGKTDFCEKYAVSDGIGQQPFIILYETPRRLTAGS